MHGDHRRTFAGGDVSRGGLRPYTWWMGMCSTRHLILVMAVLGSAMPKASRCHLCLESHVYCASPFGALATSLHPI